jgi:hypothetical protein
MRTFIVAPTAASAAFSSPAFAQQHGQDTSSIPDFSGVWHRWLRPGFGTSERSGPGPVTNRSRVNGVSNYNQLVGDYTNQGARRSLVDRRGLSNTAQPVLARWSPLHFLAIWNAEKEAPDDDVLVDWVPKIAPSAAAGAVGG